jgi:M6 family metalloprotease-like protein
MPSLGVVRSKVLFVDFGNAPAGETPEDTFARVSGATELYAEVSHGRMDYQLEPHLKWLRIPSSGSNGQSYIQTAIDLADAEVDFSGVDQVVVLNDPNSSPFFNGPSHFHRVSADGHEINHEITGGQDLAHWGHPWLNHEAGHSMGLPDLYSYGGGHPFVGEFDIMGLQSGRSIGPFTYHRWMLGWVDDDQVYCLTEGELTVDLSPIELQQGLKAVVVPTGATTGVVIESRRALGVDSGMQKEGVVVYTVDSTIGSGQGPIKIVSNESSPFYNAPLANGESIVSGNVSIEVTSATSEGDTVKVTVQ